MNWFSPAYHKEGKTTLFPSLSVITRGLWGPVAVWRRDAEVLHADYARKSLSWDTSTSP